MRMMWMLNSRIFWFFVALLISLSCTSGSGKDTTLRRLKRLFECKEKGNACWGFIPCCGDNVCYWEEGYSITTSGYCVECVPRGKFCQRDEQCCGNAMCDKGHHSHYDGYCNAPKPNGGWCYRPQQCASGYCTTPKWPKYHGQCANQAAPTKQKGKSRG